MNPKKEFYKKQAATIISQFEMRGIEGHYCKNMEEAKELALSMIESGSSVAWGGSESIREIGLLDAVKARTDLDIIDRAEYKTPEKQRELKGKIAMCDYFLMSSNAITLDGQLVNIDGAGSRLSYLIYGPENVIVVAGMNKVASNVDEAVNRVQNIASPPNTMRLGCNTPCAKTGKCGNCLSEETICCQIVVTRRSRINNRIKVILVGEELGF